MTTLTGMKLYKHLEMLYGNLEAKKSEVDMNSFDYAVHSQMSRILNAEMQFLKESNPNLTTAPRLDFSPTGFPAIEAWNADLEKICERYGRTEDLTLGNEDDLSLVASQFEKDGSFDFFNRKLYSTVSASEWEKAFFRSRSKHGTLKTRTAFYMIEENGVTRLNFAECLYADGVDRYSQTVPVLIRTGYSDYKIAWDTLFAKSTFSHLILNDSIVKSEISLLTPVKIRKFHENIAFDYDFTRKDFAGLTFWKDRRLSKRDAKVHYATFLDSGYFSRLKKISSILSLLDDAFETEVGLIDAKSNHSITRDSLNHILMLNDFINNKDPREVLVHKHRDTSKRTIDNILGMSYKSVKLKFNLVNRDLLAGQDGRYIGNLVYIVPHRDKYHSPITKGRISLKINGLSIETDEQYNTLKKGLKEICRR